MGAQHNYVHHSVMRAVYGGSHVEQLVKITSSSKCVTEFRDVWDDRFITKQERVYALFLDNQKRVLGRELINAGLYSTCDLDISTIADFAREYNSRLIVIAHNHPSGNCNPSEQDITVTREAITFFHKLNITVLDHIILTENDYYSFSDYKTLN